MPFNPCPKPEKTPKKVKQPLKRTGKPKPISIKRMILNEEYKVVRDEYMADHPVCEVKDCMHPSEDLHHKKHRSGKLLTDVEFFCAVCRYHHGEIHNKSKWAYAEGYLIKHG